MNRLISLESTDDAMLKVRSATKVNAAKQSQYKRAQRSSRTPTPEGRGRQRSRRDQPPRRRCRGCGRHSHGDGKQPLNRDDFPAKGKPVTTVVKKIISEKFVMKDQN